MIIGIILTIVLLFSFPFLFKIMSVPDYQEYTPQNILGRAGELINGVFKIGNFIQKSQKENEFRGNLYYDTNPNMIDVTSPDTSTPENYSL